MRLTLFLAVLLACPAEIRVEVRDSEVWLIRDGREKQLTYDGKSKLQAELSPAQNRIAYYEQCIEAEHCMPTVIVLTSKAIESPPSNRGTRPFPQRRLAPAFFPLRGLGTTRFRPSAMAILL